MLHVAEQILNKKLIPGKDGMRQSRAVPGYNRFLKNTGCCRAEQFWDIIDSWKTQDAAEQSSSWIEQIFLKGRVLQSRADEGQNRFLEKTGCCRAEQVVGGVEHFVEGKDSGKRQNITLQSNLSKKKYRLLPSRAICGWEKFLEE